MRYVDSGEARRRRGETVPGVSAALGMLGTEAE